MLQASLKVIVKNFYNDILGRSQNIVHLQCKVNVGKFPRPKLRENFRLLVKVQKFWGYLVLIPHAEDVVGCT